MNKCTCIDSHYAIDIDCPVHGYLVETSAPQEAPEAEKKEPSSGIIIHTYSPYQSLLAIADKMAEALRKYRVNEGDSLQRYYDSGVALAEYQKAVGK